ncbi:protein kinase domain-containing protein [Thalassiella azotivora]
MTAPSTARGRPPAVPGYRTGRLLGFGGQGEVWAAVHEQSGRRVALKALRVGEAAQARALREAMLLRRIEHRHVLRVESVVRSGDDGVVLVLEHAPGGSLAALVAARGPLDPGEVVTVLSPLAGALADLHARGLVHGDVSPGNVLFAADGRPLLADLGVASLLGVDERGERHGTPGFVDAVTGPTTPPAPAGDVFGLCAVGWFALTGRAPQPAGARTPLGPVAPGTPAELAAVVESGLDVRRSRRPTAAELSVAVYDAAPAAPVRLVPTDPLAAAADVVTHRLRLDAAQAQEEVPAVPRRRRWLRPLLVGLAAAAVTAAVLAAAVLLGVGRGPGGDGPAVAAPGATSGAPEHGDGQDAALEQAAGEDVAARTAALAEGLSQADPAGAVQVLADLRALALSTGSDVPLRAANEPGAPAAEQDAALLAGLTADGLVLQDLVFEVRRAEVVEPVGAEQSPDEGAVAVVTADVVTGPHRQVRADGAVVQEVAEGTVVTSRLTLVRLDGRWVVRSVG